ncbi:COG4223 family protein [Thalassobaculum litoreum]|uniref:Inner membrane protein n=1 Tax=Thalassobaculum litoreum DSM 18839 TaxID=1123362 RepID=A0A8G2BI60_9PROT|nr:mitofilin family membrane protein [Thalassobaculum litoreum]SDF44620.1 inner membrane protein [Thalassobaculum litoreum DSM 18839]
MPAPQPSASGGSGLVSLPIILSIAAIVIAILIPVLNDRSAEPAVTAEDLNAIKVQQTDLLTAVAGLEANIQALGVEQDAMQASIAAVKVPSIMIAATDLNDAIGSGDPFEEELALFRAIVGENDAVASVYALEPLAPAGVPTTRELQAGFGDISHAVIASYQTVESEGDLAKRVSETMANLTAATTRLRWRLDGATPPEGTSPLAIMARAEDAAEDGDFDAVILELQTLPETLKAMTADWIEQVETQQKAQTATEDLELFMIETVASTRK